MGKNLRRFLRKKKREEQRRTTIRNSIVTKPTSQKRFGGVLGEGNMGYVYLVEPGSSSPSKSDENKLLKSQTRKKRQNIR